LKLVECLTSRYPPEQVDRTARMNSHGQRFQASVGMVELLGINSPNGKVTIGRTPTTMRAMILSHNQINNNLVLLSTTKKWNSTVWQGTYILQQASAARNFAQCPAAYLGSSTTTYKHLSPDTVEESNLFEWNEDN